MATTRRWLAVSIGLVLMWPLTGAAGAENHTVLLKSLNFEPKTVEIAIGDTVVWKYGNGDRHSVTLEDGTEIGCRPGLLQENCLDQPSETRSHTFTQVGAFAYYCRFHGGRGGQGMSGVVKVASTVTTVAAASSSTTRPATSTTTAKPTTTTTARALTTSSTVMATTTTLAALPTTTLTPNDPPAFDPADPGGTTSPSGEQAASAKDEKRDSSAVALIVTLLLAVAGGGGLLLWRLRPGRGTPPGPPSPPPPGP